MRGGSTENSPKERSGAEREVRRQMEDGLGEALLKVSRQRQDRLLQRKGIRKDTDRPGSVKRLVPVEVPGREAGAKRSGNTGTARLLIGSEETFFYFTGSCVLIFYSGGNQYGKAEVLYHHRHCLHIGQTAYRKYL